MADRVTVVDPATGVELSVPADSPQARQWGRAASPQKPATTRRGAKKKND